MRTWHRVNVLLALALAFVLVLSSCSMAVTTSTITSASTQTTIQTTTGTSAKPTLQTTQSSTQTTAKSTPTQTPTQTTSAPYGKLTMALGTIGNERYVPRLADATHSLNVLSMMMDLVFWALPGKLEPRIVEKWETAPDGKSWTFHIRKGVKFHNGDDLTAKDIKFSIEEYLKPDNLLLDIGSTVSRVEIVDDYAVRVYTKAIDVYLPYKMSPYSGQGLVMPKDYIEKNGWAYFEQRPIGTNSFKFTNRVPGDSATFEALDKHWRQVPEFKTVTVVLMPEEATRVASLKTAMADVIELSLDNAAQMDAGGFRTVVLAETTPLPVFHGVYMSSASGMPTADIRVRKALSLAINRDEIRKEFFNGKAGPPMPPFIAADSPDIDIAYWKDYSAKIYAYDTAQAKRLLADAGYPNGFTFKMYTFVAPGAPYLPKLGEILASYWAALGVKVQLVPIEFGTYTTGRRGPSPEFLGNASLYRSNTGKPVTPTELESGFSTRGTHRFLRETPMEAEVDRLLAAALGEADPNKRKDLIAKVITISIETYTAFQIGSVPNLVALGPKLDISFPSPMPPRPPLYADIAKHK